MASGVRPARLRVRHVGGPTALLELGGLRLLTDPTFDPPGEYRIGSRSLTKTAGPALAPEALGAVDAVLLSHDQHPDNLDTLGRELTGRAPLVLTTGAAATRLGGRSRALGGWEAAELPRPGGGSLRVTGVPALHGPPGSEHLVGEVTGFVLSGEGLPSVYISGDNASLDLVHAIAGRLGPFEVALLFAGGARTALLGDAYLTLSSEMAAEAARILAPARIVALHLEGWAHFSEGPGSLRQAFERSGQADRLHLPDPGDEVELP